MKPDPLHGNLVSIVSSQFFTTSRNPEPTVQTWAEQGMLAAVSERQVSRKPPVPLVASGGRWRPLDVPAHSAPTMFAFTT